MTRLGHQSDLDEKRPAAERAGVRLLDSWMIGDSAENDIGAATAAGVSNVWLSRGRVWPLSDFRPNAEADVGLADSDEILQFSIASRRFLESVASRGVTSGVVSLAISPDQTTLFAGGLGSATVGTLSLPTGSS